MRLKHNKKRNVAFVYEALIRELTKAVIRKNKNRKNQIISIIRENFKQDSLLSEELSLYKTIYESKGLDKELAEKLIFEVRLAHRNLNKTKLFREQTALINMVNKKLTGDIFNNFVPNYRNIASAYSIFNSQIKPKDRIILEEKMVESMSSTGGSKTSEEKRHIDNIVYKTFVKKFNDRYSDTLLEEQKELLSRYISSFSDNGLELKVYLNEEISRLKKSIKESENEEIREDLEMQKKVSMVSEVLDRFKERPMDQEMVEKVLKIQDLVREMSK